MPSSKAALTAKIAALASENLTLKMQLKAQDDVLTMQNGAMDEMGKLIEAMPGGLIAHLQAILERHGVAIHRPQRPLQ